MELANQNIDGIVNIFGFLIVITDSSQWRFGIFKTQ